MKTKKPKKTKRRVAFVGKDGTFHCPAGHKHSRGPLNGVDVYRCLNCGSAWRVRGVVMLRNVADARREAGGAV